MKRFPGISKTIMKSLVGKPATLMYPQRKRTYTAATRGKVENEIERCIFCRHVRKELSHQCPRGQQRNQGMADRQPEVLLCRRCVEVCPVKCLTMHNRLLPACPDKGGRHISYGASSRTCRPTKC